MKVIGAVGVGSAVAVLTPPPAGSPLPYAISSDFRGLAGGDDRLGLGEYDHRLVVLPQA